MTLADTFYKYPYAVTGELLRILPDSLVMMSGLLALLTSSFPYFVLFVSLIESIFGFHLLRIVLSSVLSSFALPTKSSMTEACHTGFRSSTLGDLSFFKSPADSNSVLSAPIFSVAVAAAYVFNSLNVEIQELEALGPEYAARYYISIFSLLILLFVIGSYRLYCGCDQLVTVLLSLGVGLGLGTILIYQNYKLLGPDSINLLGIPLLKNKTVNGEPLYACTVVTKN
jgi:hypothetical protein